MILALQLTRRVLQVCATTFFWTTGLAIIADTVEQTDVGQSLGHLGLAMMTGS